MKDNFPDRLLGRWLAGLACAFAALGALVVIGRVSHARDLAAIFPGQVPLAFPTAVGFFLVAGAFAAWRENRTAALRVFSGAIAALGLLALARDFAVTFRHQAMAWIPIFPGDVSPWGGRVSPLTAGSFCALGLAFFLISKETLRARAVLLLGSAIIGFSFYTICGHVAGITIAAGWWRYTSAALPAAIALGSAGVAVIGYVVRRVPASERPAAQSLPFFVTASGMIAVVGIISYLGNGLERGFDSGVSHTQALILQLDAIEGEAQQAETIFHGLEYSGHAEMAPDFFAHARVLRLHLAALRALVGENVSQRRIAVMLAETIEQRLDAEQASVENGVEGPLPARGLEETIHRAIAELRAREQALLVQRSRESEVSAEQARLASVVGSGLALLLFFIALGLQARSETARRQADRAVKLANETLEARVAERTRELEKSVRRLQFLGDTMPQLVWTALPNGAIESTNMGWREFLGVPETEVIPVLMKCVHPDDEPAGNQEWRQMMEENRAGGGEMRLRRSDGQYRWHLWRAQPERDETGRPVRWVGTSTDIHDSRVAQEALLQKERDHHFLADAVPQMIFTVDANGRGDYLNKRWKSYCGLDDPGALGSGWLSLVHVGEAAVCQKLWTESWRTGKDFQAECRLRRADGEYRWHLARAFPQRELKGNILRWVGTCTDIHDQKMAEEKLEQRVAERTSELETVSRRFSGAAQASLDAFYIFEAVRNGAQEIQDFVFVELNERGAQMMGKPREKIIGGRMCELLVGLRERGFFAKAVSVVEKRCPLEYEQKVLTPGVQAEWLHQQVVPLGDGIAVTSRNITERKKLEASLARARDQALEASRLKSEFLANMSHEIRTPMNGIIGMATLLLDTPLDSEQREMGNVISNSAENLLGIVNDILDFSKIEAGKMRIETGEFALQPLIDETLALLAPRAREKHLQLASDFAPGIPALLQGDGGRVRQVLTNLVANAIKFTEKGRVRVVARPGTGLTRHQRETVRVEVIDTGIGIDEDSQSRLFQPFTQADGTATRRFGGTGLGLAISRQLIELMGGDIGFESESGRGSTFWFELEVPRVPAGSDSQPSGGEPRDESHGLAKVSPAGRLALPGAARERGLRALVADDNAANQLVARLMLLKMGHTVDIVADGEQALARLARHAYDVVFMDCQMPVLDGYAATRRIRRGEIPGVNPQVPIIALTAYALPDDRAKCLDAGMDAYVSKPIRAEEISSALKDCGLQVRLAPHAALAPSAASEIKVLDGDVLASMRSLPGRNGPSLLPELIALFQREEPARVAALERALAERDAQKILLLAHTLAGSSANLGGKHVRTLALELEQNAFRADWPEINATAAKLRVALGELKHALSAYEMISV